MELKIFRNGTIVDALFTVQYSVKPDDLYDVLIDIIENKVQDKKRHRITFSCGWLYGHESDFDKIYSIHPQIATNISYMSLVEEIEIQMVDDIIEINIA